MRCAVLGDPIAHSLSPTLHRAAYAELGLDWTYDAVRVPAGGLADFVRGLGPEWRGLSLTMPLKREALPLATRVSPRAGLAGAANTLVREGEGWFADNTDIPGAVEAIREKFDGPVDEATILGGGATATSTALALADLGCRSITLLVRSPERAAESVAAVSQHPLAPVVTVGSLTDDPIFGQLLVSTVPVEAQTPDLVARCAGVPVLFEVLYHPWPTPLAASAGDRPLVGGLDLLVHQAVLQVELCTGRSVGVDVLRRNLS